MKAAGLFAIPALLGQVIMALPTKIGWTRYSPLSLEARAFSSPSSSSSSSSSSPMSPRCSFHDGHGPVPCDHFSVLFGDGGLFSSPTDLFIKGSNFEARHTLSCIDPGVWSGFASPLPYVLSVVPGNACRLKIPKEKYDGTHIKYANQFLNTPADSRCSRVGKSDAVMRCLIKQRP